MPYISQVNRDKYDEFVSLLIKQMKQQNCSSGELNYIITRLIHAYTAQSVPNYATLNEVVGVLESAKAEYQRRVVAPYEDKKIKENGDLKKY